MNRKIVLYGNGSSGNHGCEAIYRGTKTVLECPLLIQTENENEDRKYGIDRFSNLYPSKSANVSVLDKIKAYYLLKAKGSFVEMDGIYYLEGIKRLSKMSDLAFSVGGDNYCYGYPEIYAFLNRMYNKYGFKTVLWGCSVEPALMTDAKVVEDLKNYRLIVARESITCDALKEIGANVMYCPDPAFFMKPEPIEIDERFATDTVGINCSPMIIFNEQIPGIAYQNYKELINYILRETNMNIALIPHVVWEKSDDCGVLLRLYEECDDKSRVIVVKDNSAPRLKYIISRCKVFVGARTHATIAAYSSGIPTLVVGYSVKARGIAKDLMKDMDNFILPVQELRDAGQLAAYTRKLIGSHDTVKARLNQSMSDYDKYKQLLREKIWKLQ